MANIFISYSRHSQNIAKTLAADIEELGHTVWFDQALSGGQVWWQQILSRIRDCQVFVFVVDPKALDSTACRREYGYATDLGKPILPVRAVAGISTNLLPPALSNIQFVDYEEHGREAALRLARALAAITVSPPKQLPDPLPVPPEVPISYLGGLAERVETTATLCNEEQGTLVAELRRSLRESETAKDSRALLEKLRKRRDLFASIADEIDELLANLPKAWVPHPRTHEPEVQDHATFRRPEETVRTDSHDMESLPQWRSWLLAYKQVSIKGTVYKVLFYFLLTISVLGIIGKLTEGSGSADIGSFLLGLGIFVTIALAFRAAAVRDYRKRLKKRSNQYS